MRIFWARYWHSDTYIHTYTLFILEIYRVAIQLISSRKEKKKQKVDMIIAFKPSEFSISG